MAYQDGPSYQRLVESRSAPTSLSCGGLVISPKKNAGEGCGREKGGLGERKQSKTKGMRTRGKGGGGAKEDDTLNINQRSKSKSQKWKSQSYEDKVTTS